MENWKGKLDKYLDSQECEDYGKYVEQNQGFYLIVSVLFGKLQGDWNLLDFSKISMEDIKKVEKFIAYGDRWRMDEADIKKFAEFETNYDMCDSFKRHIISCKSQHYEVNHKVDCI